MACQALGLWCGISWKAWVALGGMEDSVARSILHRIIWSSFIVGGSQSPALGIQGPQSGGLGVQSSGDRSLTPNLGLG